MSNLEPIVKGAVYTSTDDAINAVRAHAHYRGYSCKITDRNLMRSVLKCSSRDCMAYIRIRFTKKKEQYIVSKMLEEHSCRGILETPRGTQKNHQFLVNLLLNCMPVSQATRIKDIRQFFKQQSGIIVAYSTAHKA
jgi:hypothetical protein